MVGETLVKPTFVFSCSSFPKTNALNGMKLESVRFTFNFCYYNMPVAADKGTNQSFVTL